MTAHRRENQMCSQRGAMCKSANMNFLRQGYRLTYINTYTQTGLDGVRFNVPPNTCHIGDEFLRASDPTNSVKALKEDRFLRIRIQFHQVHPTLLTIIQQIRSIKQKIHKIQTHKHK